MMKPKFLLMIVIPVALTACGPVATTNVTVSGGAVVGTSYGGAYNDAGRFGAGPPSGRTEAERQQRRDYYRGPRGAEF